jgi:predicted enzyme related to lactoylglutathione lyase
MMLDPMKGQPRWGYYFNVDSCNGAVERIKKNGGKLMHGPNEVPGPMFVATCADPQGAVFSVVGQKA